MKKDNLPQDTSKALKDFTREVCYVKDENGKYEKALSTGWDVKSEALDEAWAEINRRIEEAAQDVKNGIKSPVAFFMEVMLMDLPTLSGYTGFWGITIKRHMKPSVFKKLSKKRLDIYAREFKITTDELVNFDGTNIDKYTQK